MVLLYIIQAGMRFLMYCVLSNGVDKITTGSNSVLFYIAPNYVLHRLGFEEDFEEAESLSVFAFPLKNIFKNFIIFFKFH